MLWKINFIKIWSCQFLDILRSNLYHFIVIFFLCTLYIGVKKSIFIYLCFWAKRCLSNKKRRRNKKKTATLVAIFQFHLTTCYISWISEQSIFYIQRNCDGSEDANVMYLVSILTYVAYSMIFPSGIFKI